MLYIDPEACINCGACADACPVEAISPIESLQGGDQVFADLNRRYYEEHPTDHAWGAPEFPRSLPKESGPLRVAIVGTGPAAGYAAQKLLRSTDAEITLLDRLPVAGGLLRSGVAPDHPSTKRIGDSFAEVYRHSRVSLALNVEVGKDITAAELAAHHSAVLYAVGASADRALDVPGEHLPGSLSATEFVAWYNAHPDLADLPVDLSAERAVVVGTGNVALDVARILLRDPDELARTDIADHALVALRDSAIREVVLLGRRGPEHAAFSRPEFFALAESAGIEVVLADSPEIEPALRNPKAGSKAELLAGLPRETIDWSTPPRAGKRLVLRFDAPVAAVDGETRVTGVRIRTPEGEVRTREGEDRIPAGLLLRAIGYRGRPLPGLPFDETTGTVPHESGRVLDDVGGTPLPGTYVTGWIKRGPSGGIGANRRCAEETVAALLDDAEAGRLPVPTADAREFRRLLKRRQPAVVDRRGLLAIDAAERSAGLRAGRPRVKFASIPDLLRAGGHAGDGTRRLSTDRFQRRDERALSRPSA
jgi:ferredoxin--NADP+ reductase